MSRAYKKRKKTREIGDLTYPSGGSRVSLNAYLKKVRKMTRDARKRGEDVPKFTGKEYSEFVKMGNYLSRGEQG